MKRRGTRNRRWLPVWLTVVSLASCDGSGAVTAASFVGFWEAVAFNADSTCNTTGEPAPPFSPFVIQFRTAGPDRVDVSTLLTTGDRGCATILTVRGNVANLMGEQECDGATWTKDTFTLSKGGTALAEIGAFHLPAGSACLTTLTASYVKTSAPDGGSDRGTP